MANPNSERRGFLTVAAYSIGAGLAALLFWFLDRFLRRRRPEPATPPVTPEIIGPAYEIRDANVRNVTIGAIGFLIALGLIVVATSLLFFAWTGTAPRLQLPPPGEAISSNPPTPRPPPPRLETQPGQVLRPLLANEEQTLRSYAWVNRQKGIVRLPIDRAMDLVAESGLPTRPTAQSQGYRDEGRQAPSGSSSGRASEELLH